MKTSFKPKLLVLGPKETQVWFLIFVISFWCFSVKSVSSVVLLVNKHQKFVKCPAKTSFKPNCSFQARQKPKFRFLSLKSPYGVLAPKVSQVRYFCSTNTKSMSNSPLNQVLSPIARFRPDRNTSLVFYFCNLLFMFQRQKCLKCGTFGQQTPKVCQMPHQNKF